MRYAIAALLSLVAFTAVVYQPTPADTLHCPVSRVQIAGHR